MQYEFENGSKPPLLLHSLSQHAVRRDMRGWDTMLPMVRNSHFVITCILDTLPHSFPPLRTRTRSLDTIIQGTYDNTEPCQMPFYIGTVHRHLGTITSVDCGSGSDGMLLPLQARLIPPLGIRRFIESRLSTHRSDSSNQPSRKEKGARQSMPRSLAPWHTIPFFASEVRRSNVATRRIIAYKR